ncbi:MAG: hypothetical protein A3C11_02640 [Candidatus Sungbacteria bacterium RIFCSPHIGHO2_02_FULL_49_12]|uniref:Uncharacterized protein n=1 Tax=Candidatus Sungbacteria bacterium RIFCSPHIGHO2_02_FULL_49_12 TaxID=1802271 RepID=A0A1G2KSF0_9BACT|nr:MAG: hypothetical protein A3C11_02640 [Candidatus Sungbacteria bacterium RIFCSPHIGHO2_02_FULL_49_12]
MDDISKELADQKELLRNIFVSVEKTRRAFTWTLIISLLVVVLPLIGLIFVIPQFLSLYSGVLP